VVEQILRDLELQEIPYLKVFNKVDLVEQDFADFTATKHSGITACAHDSSTFSQLLKKIQDMVMKNMELTS
jgi:50S ribosomal subunit-associated GTPase HflX